MTEKLQRLTSSLANDKSQYAYIGQNFKWGKVHLCNDALHKTEAFIDNLFQT